MKLQEMADVLLSAWTLATDQGTRLPTGQGILDRALKTAIENGNFPQEFKRLRFVRTRVGTRCTELGAILSWAQASGQTSDPNPSYEFTQPKISKTVAEIILSELEIDPVEAAGWGKALSKAIEEQLDKEPRVASI